jgi:hypothetical protein
MPENLTIKPEAFEPLFAAWREPEKHRVKRADGGDGFAHLHYWAAFTLTGQWR